ncbi:hypothetical protein K1719_011350 [Acacia pycnantha]|nr:hypothetical protein K1719_011350 [Acacia pycnantha]
MERNVNEDSGIENSPCKKQLNGVSILWFPVMQAVLPEKESLVKNCSKFVLVLWLILAFVLMQSYTACLSSILTVHQLQPRYLSEYDVINDPNANIGYNGGSYFKGFLLERLKVDKHRAGGFGFAFPKGSTLTSHFSTAILNVRESPEMDEIERKYFGSSNNDEGQSLSDSSIDDDASQSSLTTYSFAGLFLLIGIFFVSAVIVSESRIWHRFIIEAKMINFDLEGRGDGDTGWESGGGNVVVMVISLVCGCYSVFIFPGLRRSPELWKDSDGEMRTTEVANEACRRPW